MPVLDICIYPDESLRRVAQPVETFDEGVRTLLRNMADTMYDAPGIGLAGPQVGVAKRVLVIDIAPMLPEGEEGPGLLQVINPKILSQTGDSTFQEGCLSLPGLMEEIERPAEVTVEFFTPEGVKQTIQTSGILATALQHEIDHLDGVLILDFLSPIKRSRYKSWLKKELKKRQEAGDTSYMSFGTFR